MFAGASGSVRKTFIVGASLVGALPAVAQQVANVDVPQDRAAYLAAACNHVRDAATRVGCQAEATLRFDRAQIAAGKQIIEAAKQTTAAAQNESAALRTENTCQQTLIGMVKDGKKDAVKAAYAGRPVGSVSACEILSSLTKG